MRVALVTATPQSVRAGSGTFVATTGLARGLEELGHSVEIVAPAHLEDTPGFTLRRFAFNVRLQPADVLGADVVVGFDMDGYRFAGRVTPPFVAYIHGTIADEARFERGLVRATMRLQAAAERRSVRRSVRTLTVTHFARHRVAALYGVSESRIGVVPPAFDVDGWRSALPRAEIRAGPPTVLAVGHLYPRKSFGTLLEAASLLRHQVPDLRVRIVGHGPERRRIERAVERLHLAATVTLTGQIAFTDLVTEYAACDVFCLPSRQEGFGLVFLEAMMAQKPIVACRSTAAEEVVIDGVHGMLVPIDDPGALAAALARLLTDAELRRRLGNAGPARAAQFAPEPVARQFVAELPLGPRREEEAR